MHKFLQQKIPTKTGNILNTKGEIVGTHDGAYFYTIGQRKGIKIGGGPALFVVKKDVEKNEIVVGNEADMELYNQDLTASKWHWIGNEQPFPLKGCAKIRYRQPDQEVEITLTDAQTIHAHFTEPQRAITSGQTIAVYQGDELVASALIR